MVQVHFLLMLSNAVAMTTSTELAATMSTGTSAEMRATMNTARAALKAAQKAGMSTKAEIQSLMALQFAEPLPKVTARALKTSKVMHVSEAMGVAGHKMPKEITALLQEGRNKTHHHDADGDDSRPLIPDSSLRSLVKTRTEDDTHAVGGLQRTDSFEKAMAFINGEYMVVREKLDLKLLECGFFKLVKEKLLYETQDKLDELAMDMGLAEATMENCMGEIQKQSDIIFHLTVELNELTRQCKLTHDELFAVKVMIEEDLKVINLILNVTREECVKMGVKVSASSAALLQTEQMITVHACLGHDGKTYFETGNSLIQKHASTFKTVTSQQAFQRALFETYGMSSPLPGKLNLKTLDDFDSDEDEDDFPEGLQQALEKEREDSESFVQIGEHHQLKQPKKGPTVGAPSKPSTDDQRERCNGVAAKPNCRKILDKLAVMKGEITDRLEVATKALQKWDAKCEAEISEINTEISVARGIISTQTTELQKATAFHNGLAIEHGEQLRIKEELCEDLRIKYTECYKQLKEMEREMCGLLVIRQAVYNRVKNPDKAKPDMMIQDCIMGDWIVGECSSTCLDAQGRPGIQIISRQETGTPWDPDCKDASGAKAAEDKCPGRYGASCPPDAVDRDCATEYCPIDCVVGDWSGWSECTAPCGGGSFERARQILTPQDHGGKPCPNLADSGECNMDACDKDCVLSDWSAWGPCSKSCLGKSTWRPGSYTRTKSIKEPTVGAGYCPEPHTEMRFEKENCNTFMCPKNIECVADLDVVLVHDGSGSLWYRWGGRPLWDRNFKLSTGLTANLVKESKMATVDANGKPSDGLRYGVVLYSFNPRVISQITEKASDLETAIKAMKWPMGGTMTGRALLKAMQLFPLAEGSGKRMQVIMLITDGRASNRYWAWQAAYAVRNAGVRLIIIPVKGALRNLGDMCAWATKPCNENMIITPKFTMLQSKLQLYLTTMCPQVEVRKATR